MSRLPNPQPTTAVRMVRRLSCRYDERCLNVAIIGNWPSMTCAMCPRIEGARTAFERIVDPGASLASGMLRDSLLGELEQARKCKRFACGGHGVDMTHKQICKKYRRAKGNTDVMTIQSMERSLDALNKLRAIVQREDGL